MSPVAHHIVDGPVEFKFDADLKHAVSNFPSEWSRTPWPAHEAGLVDNERVFGMTPLVIIVGSDKGGTGKTMTSRALLDFLDSKAIKNRAFDTENAIKEGVLRRFFPDRTSIVDLTDSDGQMQIFDTLGAEVTVIDIRASLLSPTLKLLNEIGFLDPAKCRIVVLHVLGNSQASIGEVKSIADSIASSRYVAIANHVTETKFAFPAGALDIPMLNARACESVDAASTSFSAYINSGASSVLRGIVKHWLGQVFAQFETAPNLITPKEGL
jgi:hypothetical protein